MRPQLTDTIKTQVFVILVPHLLACSLIRRKFNTGEKNNLTQNLKSIAIVLLKNQGMLA
jgi:hypothetical protein